MSAFPISPGGKPITNEEARTAVETALFEMGLTRPMTLAEKDAFCETAKSSLNYQSNSYRVKESRLMQMTEKEDDKVGEDFVQAWRIMDEVIGSILRENPNLNPGRKRDQDVIARLLNEK